MQDQDILIALGGNLPHPVFGEPRRTLEAALRKMEARGVRVIARSRWFRSAPVPPSDQPWFVNAVARVETEMSAGELMATLHAVEDELGRARKDRNEARLIDLDLLAYGRRVRAGRPGDARSAEPELPHPRLHERAFVLRPLAEVAPGWRHPATGRSVEEMIGDLPEDQVAEPCDAD